MNSSENTTIQYLHILYQSTFLPLQYYQGKECLFRLPFHEIPFSFADFSGAPQFSSNDHMHYAITNEFLYYGCVHNPDTDETIIAGPISTTRIRQDSLPRILMEWSVSPTHKDDVWNYFQITPTFSHEQFLNLLSLINITLNHEILNPTTYFTDTSASLLNRIGEKHSASLYQAKEEEIFHNTYQFERELYHYVEEGNLEALKRLLSYDRNFSSGTIGETSLRQEKNIAISSITQLTRHSITGGLDIETAYQLSDTYIQESEKSTSIDQVKRLTYTALIDFTNRVAANKIPQGMSPDIFACMQFISTHTNQSISVSDVADAIGRSPSYVSKKFKKELGFNLNEFIMRRKLEEAKSLLAFTDKSLSEISEYLCFSSQSYFQNVFKKKYHVTPYEYRKSTQ
ncbi:MAG: helix-turn-helix domain-containing protein [Hespellia sp.]|nr:helix-turn-helix domain-containing protein [Hespellia sp.]